MIAVMVSTTYRVHIDVRRALIVIVSDVCQSECPGPSGRSLIEIQTMSGASIQISKKGTFAPGTRNRIVTICGVPNALTMAAYLIEQKIQEEESKRARQMPIAAIQ